MESMAIMAIMSIMTSIITAVATSKQQEKEFSQQEDLLQQQMNYQTEREDINWNRQRPGQIYDDYLAEGFNPNLAAQAVLGGNSESVTAGSSPSAPSTNSAISALQSALGQGSQSAVDSFLKQAQIENLQANTNKIDVEAGIMPRDYQLRVMTTDAQLRLWNKSVEKTAAEIGLTKTETRLVEQQNLYYGRKAEAEIASLQEQANKAIAEAQLAYERINTEKSEQAVNSAEVILKGAQTSNVIQDTANKIIEGDLTFQQSERERIAKEFEQKMNGVPLTADAQKYVNSLVQDGKWEEVSQFYQCVFTAAQAQEVGTTLGSPRTKIGLPFNLFNYEGKNFPLGVIQNNPYWNPNLRQ